jgi:hypothetical protein
VRRCNIILHSASPLSGTPLTDHLTMEQLVPESDTIQYAHWYTF